jgi:hypothetical protein
MSDYIIIALLTLAVYYPLTLLAVGIGAVGAAVRAVRQGGV